MTDESHPEGTDYDNFARWLRGTPVFSDDAERCTAYRRVFLTNPEALRVLRDLFHYAAVFQPVENEQLERAEGRRDICCRILTLLNQNPQKLRG